MWAKQKGFTIVELLIVIVVIGILAAITIAAFNGIQNRANNTRITSMVRSYVTAVKANAAETGNGYLTTTSCLGVGYQGAICHMDGGMYSENFGSFNDTLKNYLGTVPAVKSVRSPLAGKWVDSALYTVNNGSYNATGSAFAFAQYGVSSCPKIDSLRELSTSPSPFTDGSGVWCRFALD